MLGKGCHAARWYCVPSVTHINGCVTHIKFVRYCLSDIGLSDDIVCPTAYIRSWWYCLVQYAVVGMPGMQPSL